MKILTHDSYFHSDDVFAVATLLTLFPDATVERSRDPELIAAADYVVDVGMVYDPAKHRFDHHQPEGAGVRPNGIPYASFGLVWKEFGEKIAGGKVEAEVIDNILAQPLDAHDNGMMIADDRIEDVRDYTLNDFIYSYLPRPRPTNEDIYKIFMNLTAIAKELIGREVAKAKEIVKGEARVVEIFDKTADKRIVVLEEDLPWKSVFAKRKEVLFVVHPRPDGYWSLRTVEETGYTPRRSLPKEWGGLAAEELRTVTGVKDAIFCHRALFMAAARSKEGALALAKLALNA